MKIREIPWVILRRVNGQFSREISVGISGGLPGGDSRAISGEVTEGFRRFFFREVH